MPSTTNAMPALQAKIPFNRPLHTQKTLEYFLDVFNQGHASGDGKYTKLCHQWLESQYPCQKALMTHSCTAALEMSAILANIQPGDEVIMPSYTFVSTANAFVLRGAVPVFVDIRPDTLNLDETLIEAAVTSKTKAIAPVHYAGVSCEMDTINTIAKQHKLSVIEDAAQGFGSTYKGKALGTIGCLGSLSFHETKNLMSGEGGALLINNPELNERAEIIREKGTNRSRFFRGQVDKYTWVDIGSSYLPTDLVSAYLYSVLEIADEVQQKRMQIWERYNAAFAPFEQKGLVRRPIIPEHCTHNAHMFYLLFNDFDTRSAFIADLKENNILAPFHYISLHSSPAGLKYGRASGNMQITNKISDTLVRLPLFYNLEEKAQDRIMETAINFLQRI